MAVMSRMRFAILMSLALLFALGGALMVVEGREGGWPVLLFFLSSAVVFTVVRYPRKLTSEPSVSIVAAYPEPVTLVGQRGRNLLIAGVSAVLALIPSSFSPAYALPGGVISHLAFSMVFGVPALVLAAVAIRPNRLTLDSEGMKFTTLLSTKQWSWRDVQDFTPVSSITRAGRIIPVRQIIGFTDRNADEPGRSAPQSGKNSMFANQFAVSDEELASALNFWRRRGVAD
ncbi:hypothetical protein HNR26_002978 [Rhizobium rosettiformans]|uniref:PH domain-containing protein n=3 Tax=Rhizobium rosettiformans TaxID=1368430 RepID=A0A4V4HQQ9_9HYPH|nr:hypothetical protein [Rhizobium rosettiformans]MBB5276900.1 hypothetical protein [Rhizobium rosettiformans]THV34716.1 hypothetical protein FAA86_13590 [Rhizobium rosettiformans W3]